jgi:antitoxin ParD1/3/4
MTTMNISLPDDLRTYVEEQVLQGEYALASEYFRDLVRGAQRRKAKVELEANLLDGLQGTSARMTRKDWQSIEQDALQPGPRKRLEK